MSLHEELQTLASSFVEQVLAEIKKSTLDQLTGGDAGEASARRSRPPGRPPAAAGQPAAKAPAAKPTGRLKRRTPEEIAAVVAQMVDLLKKSPEGLRAEQIRAGLGVDARELPRVIKEGIEQKAIKILGGNKRSTTYGVVGAGSARAKPAKKTAKAKAKTKASKKAARVGKTRKTIKTTKPTRKR